MTGASITGAARAELMMAVYHADRPIYCDTDSVVCRNLDMPKHPTELGAWKLETVANESAIARKKLYALFQDGKVVKQASKGVRLTAEQIRSVCMGNTVVWEADAPTINIAGIQTFMRREIKMGAI